MSNFKDRIINILRRPQVWGFAVSVAVMAAVSLAFFAPDNFEGNSLEQHDMQQGAANGEEGRAYQEATGEKALWTNALFSGMPTFQISPEYESNSMFTWINKVYGLGLPSPSNLLFMMMLGMFIMCYCLRMRWWYALIASLGWGLSSYFIIIIGAGHIWKFLALTYVPPTIGAVIMAYRGRPLIGSAILALFAMMELNANHPQITYYSFIIMLALVIAFLVEAIRKHDIKSWLVASGLCLLAGILAVGANSPSLYNTYQYSKETKRAQSELTPLNRSQASETEESERPTGGLPKAEIGGWSNTPSESFSLLIPNIKGGATVKPVKEGNPYLSLGDLAEYQNNSDIAASDVFQLIPGLPQYFGGKGFTNGPFYLGALLCALFLLGCLLVKGPVKWSLAIVTVFSIFLAMGNHFEALTDFMIYNVPLYNKFRAAETALVIAALCVPVLGALGLQRLFSGERTLRQNALDLGIAFGIPVLICLLAALAPGLFGSPFTPEESAALDNIRGQISGQPAYVVDGFNTTVDNIRSLRLGMVSADAWRSLLFLVLGGAIILFTAARKQPAWLGALGVGVLVLLDLYNVDKRYVSTECFAAALEDETLAIQPDQIDMAISTDKDYYRVVDLTAFGDARRSFFHHMVGGYHAAKLNRYNDLIERRMAAAQRVGQYIPEAREDSLIALYPADQQPILHQLAADYRVLDMLNTRYIISKDGLDVNPHASGPAWMAQTLKYVDNADAEMAALSTIDPTSVAVADKRFREILGESVPSLVPGDTVVMTKYTPNTLDYTVTTKNGGVAVFSEIWFPWGWKATIDGEPAQLGRVNYVLRALRVPAGTHKVEMTFNPDSLGVTESIAYICVTLVYLLLALALFASYVRGEGWRTFALSKDNSRKNSQV